ncbi:hypothetical protein, partial [Marivita sp. S2033]|uniref:hypothetical protein n=1 Tax=Marivita sp. S2033 TaxID=3373187 RepID=UPI0039828830
ALFLITCPKESQAQVWKVCIEEAQSEAAMNEGVLGLAPSEAEGIVSQISDTIGLNRPVDVVPCEFMRDIAIVPPTAPSVGDYILINTGLLSFVLDGDTPEQAHFIVAHELAHILNADFSPKKAAMARRQKEDEADLFGVCAVARLGGSWTNLERFLKRLRSVEHDDYSLYDEVSDALKTRFENCA